MRSRLRFCTLALLLAFIAACYSVKTEGTSIGGGWTIQKQTMTGSETSHSKLLLYRGRTEIADWVDRYKFFAPDCVIYHVNADDRPWMAICGDRAPIVLPGWLMELRDDGPWGGYMSTTDANGKTTERWSRLPLDRVVATAQAQPSFRTLIGLRRRPATPEFERVYVTLRVAPPLPPPPPVKGENDSVARIAAFEALAVPLLCASADQQKGVARPNDDQLAISEVGGGVAVVTVQAVGTQFSEWSDWRRVEEYVQSLIVNRPLTALRYRPWVDPDKKRMGIIGSLQFKSGVVGHFEAVGQHMCLADSNGDVWWVSVAQSDVFITR